MPTSFTINLTEDQMRHLLYVCEDMSEPYADMADEEDDGGRPFVDRPDGDFLRGVSDTLDDIKVQVLDTFRDNDISIEEE